MANWLQARNYYIYQLADPFRSFGQNLRATVHLLLVHMKRFFPSRPSMIFFHVKVFVKALGETSAIKKKWVRDRAGGHPELIKEGLSVGRVEVLGGANQTHRSGRMEGQE